MEAHFDIFSRLLESPESHRRGVRREALATGWAGLNNLRREKFELEASEVRPAPAISRPAAKTIVSPALHAPR